MPEEKILTWHPRGKGGKNISKEKYQKIRSAMVSALREKELTHDQLLAQIARTLKGKFSGNSDWYAETVKLDLEARKLIARTASKPQKYRLS